ncbi:hypothetical protein A8B82_18895 [Sulfitobacter sp. EhC04]|uniref:hypothetical protein n=1 Tax=Sulfitobacter sp. EhC04 TaxID=1849168 RepID=UPI0007F38B56|nr:hypothetical protein [Sulfitobacter sp. EhC04]OAN74086.1 hypothetical protein A8B82_18895 [Sulfitobacter sp. EhC04]
MIIQNDQRRGPEPITTREAQAWLCIGPDKGRDFWETQRWSTHQELFWEDLWMLIGLAPCQPSAFIEELKRPLWETKKVAEYISKTPKVVAAWHKKSTYPTGFSSPALVVGPRKKLWLPIEVEAYRHGQHFTQIAKSIRRRRGQESPRLRQTTEPLVTLDPLTE